MPNKRGGKYNSKSVLTLKSYTPEEIQKFLNSGSSKKSLAKQLGVHDRAFDQYIVKNNLTYTTPDRSKKHKKVKYNDKDVVNDDPLENFKRIFAERKLKRTLKELRDGCY
ncbi:MAG: hypothetical protein ACO21S_09415 [Sediminibacterium sp.]|jgi:YesN/AraC family two-component response regulator